MNLHHVGKSSSWRVSTVSLLLTGVTTTNNINLSETSQELQQQSNWIEEFNDRFEVLLLSAAAAVYPRSLLSLSTHQHIPY